MLQIQNKYLVEGMDTVVKYSIYNVGDAAAVDIKLTEAGFGADDFEVAGGNLAVQVDRMAPKANNSFVVSLTVTEVLLMGLMVTISPRWQF